MSSACHAIAHRGLSGSQPENSMASFEAALDHASVLELDVRATHDCVLVCTHDRTLSRTHEVDEHIGRMTWDELHEAAPEVPRLEEVLEAFGDRCGWFIDCKIARPRAIDELERVVESVGISWDSASALRSGTALEPGTACFEAADAQLLQSFGSRNGAGCVELIRGTSTALELALTAPFITAYAHGVTIPDVLATPRMLRMLRALKLGTYVYTINDGERYAELVAAGASGIFTDHCDKLG